MKLGLMDWAVYDPAIINRTFYQAWRLTEESRTSVQSNSNYVAHLVAPSFACDYSLMV